MSLRSSTSWSDMMWFWVTSCLFISFRLVICTSRCCMRSSACASERFRREMSTSRCRFCTVHAYERLIILFSSSRSRRISSAITSGIWLRTMA